MKLKDLFRSVEDYTIINKEDKLEIWRCLNGMENFDSFQDRRAFRTKIEEILDMKHNKVEP